MPDQPKPDSGFDVALAVWRRRRWLGVLVFAGILAASLSFSLSLPALYRSTATVVVERPVQETIVRPTVTGELETRLQSISQEILSRARLEGLIERFDLYPELRRAPREFAIEQMRKDIQLEPKVVMDQGSGARLATIGFALSFRGTNPETVANVTNALAQFYVEQNLKIRERQATGTTEFLKAQLADMKKKLDDQERHIGDAPRDTSADLAALEGLNNRLRMNGDRQLRALDRRERLIKELRDSGGSIVAGMPDVGAARLAKLKGELAELRTRYSDKYPDVVRVKAEIAELERTLAATPEPAKPAATAAPHPGKDPLAEIDQELRTLKGEETRLRETIAGYERRLDTAPKTQQDFQRQARDYVTTKELYGSLLKRLEDAQMTENMEQGQRGEQFRVLDAAVPSREPILPNRGRFIATGLMLSLAVAVGAVVVAERADTSFHSLDELRAFTRVPVVASIPRVVTEGDVRRRRRWIWLVGAAVTIGIALVVALVYLYAHGNSGLVRVLPGQ
jgi:succinoglycan biosynthesis transport protein ExoP